MAVQNARALDRRHCVYVRIDSIGQSNIEEVRFILFTINGYKTVFRKISSLGDSPSASDHRGAWGKIVAGKDFTGNLISIGKGLSCLQ